jgi:DNA-binding MarR family transcriptional regulator
MELEKEIQQAKFQTEYQKLMLNILFTANWLHLKQIQLLKPHGISPQQYNILRILRGQHPQEVTVSSLTERMLDKNSNASRLVEKLRTKNLIERRECPEDRRAVNVKITGKGLTLLLQLDAVISESESVMHKVSEEEAHRLNGFLDRLHD